MAQAQRVAAEERFAEELAELARHDRRPRPPNWRLSPAAVVDYLMGAQLPGGFEVTPKYVGDRRRMEVAVATLATDRALLLFGLPGTAKSWVSEHLAAAIAGDSTLLVQGTAGTEETALRYGWNYAMLLARGPVAEAMVPSPVMVAMERGTLARLEELTRLPGEVQDALITILSERVLPVPELNRLLPAAKGFNLIATANNRDKGVAELSSALQRRFNTVVLPVPATLDEEAAIVSRRAADLGRALELPPEGLVAAEVRRVVTILRELRSGVTEDGQSKLKSPSGTLSTAEAIGVMTQALALAVHHGNGRTSPADVAASLVGTVVREPATDAQPWREYLQTVVKGRDGWRDLYKACKELGD